MKNYKCNKVLIIEDDTSLRNSIIQTLDLEGIEGIPANGFQQAKRSIRSNFRGVILSDIKMPEHSGFEVLHFVRKRDADLPVILLTGFSDVPTATKSLKEGAFDYLEKPCDPDRLLNTLYLALSHRELVLQNRYLKKAHEQQNNIKSDRTLTEQLDEEERKIIEHALMLDKGKVNKAANRLGIARNTLYDRMTRLGIIAKKYR